jgi:pimeloyl-ACP methyl ester carboxylesterase
MGDAFTVDACLDAVDEAVMDLGGRVVVVGLSLGGYLGIAYTARHPERVAGLLACGCCTEPDQPVTGAWLRAAQLIERLPDHGARLNQALVDRALPAEGAQALADGGFALDVMVDLLGAMRTVRPLEDLRRIRCPVWLVNGAWDHFRTQERAYLRACPSARLVTIHRATHLANLVQPVAFNRALLEALDEVDAAEVGGGQATVSPAPAGR